MKRKILFVIESLACSGAEKSLVSLLNQINYNDYEVDLQLFSYGHPFEKYLPKEVNLLPQLPFFKASQKSLIKLFFQSHFRFLFDRIKYSIQLRINKKGVTETACLMWQCTNTSFSLSDIKYDVAVAYAQGVPTFYVADKIIATKKIGWINAVYLPTGYFFSYINSFYDNFHHIVCVSDTIEKKVIETFQMQANKTVVIQDILSEKVVTEQSNEIEDNQLKKDKNEFLIITIGNLKITKGYDLVLQSALILKNKGINFKWYILGKGPYKDEMIKFIDKHKLANNVFLLGIKDNPYPYIKKSDVLVHASRFEGYGMVLAEAKILNKPIVSTNFDAVYAQISHKENGLIVEMNENAIVEGLLEIMQDKNLYDSIVANLKKAKKGNVDEILNFYNLISCKNYNNWF